MTPDQLHQRLLHPGRIFRRLGLGVPAHPGAPAGEELVQGRIVKGHQLTVPGHLEVRLQDVGLHLHRQLIGGPGVFRSVPRGSAMGDDGHGMVAHQKLYSHPTFSVQSALLCGPLRDS